jgi:hypothetical protein
VHTPAARAVETPLADLLTLQPSVRRKNPRSLAITDLSFVWGIGVLSRTKPKISSLSLCLSLVSAVAGTNGDVG